MNERREAAAPPPVGAEAWKQTLKYEEEPMLSLALRWPTLPDTGAALRRVDRCCRRTAGAWRDRWTGPLAREAAAAAAAAREQSRPIRPWEARLDFTITYRENGLLSLFWEAYEYTGGAHGTTVRFGDTWDLATGTPRSLWSFFPSRSRPKRQLLAAAREQICQRLATGESLYYDDWPRRLSADFSPDRFYLTEGDRLAFFYPLYTLAPYAEGLPVFSIPCPLSLSCEKEENSGPKNCKKNQ